jgi:hypothetical protein
MIELVSEIKDKTLLSENEFFTDLLKHAVEIIPEADYGKSCIFCDDFYTAEIWDKYLDLLNLQN